MVLHRHRPRPSRRCGRRPTDTIFSHPVQRAFMGDLNKSGSVKFPAPLQRRLLRRGEGRSPARRSRRGSSGERARLMAPARPISCFKARDGAPGSARARPGRASDPAQHRGYEPECGRRLQSEHSRTSRTRSPRAFRNRKYTRRRLFRHRPQRQVLPETSPQREPVFQQLVAGAVGTPGRPPTQTARTPCVLTQTSARPSPS